ncbi:hypothetical protein Dsin_028046 [Dipteronia sinensis]|uniref:Uncharacterized protein n=1 Tax=Dipteronia sinensis TaxID=43782 RepID=A0AAE0DU21_9ROSI|nr:hypothetical protein Dsin_028046 [Dipteronia sinensis]
MLLKDRDQNLFKETFFGASGSQIAHLQFADNTILFIEANEEAVVNLRRVLQCYGLGSGPNVNFHKSCLVKVGKGNSNVERWAELFRCKTASLPIKYLGLSLGGRPSSISFWEPMLDKIRTRLAPWKMTFISKAGRLVLIKLVLSSLPTYFMSVFKIPISVALAMEKLQRDFFWGVKGEKKGIHWVDWPTLCKSKRNCGLGIGRIQDKGDALLAKWVWRFGMEEGELRRRVICEKYLVDPRTVLWD